MIPVADGHCDFLYGMVEYGYDLNEPKKGQSIILKDMLDGGVRLQFFAAWIDMTLKTSPLHQCIQMIEAYNRMLEENPDVLFPLKKEDSLKEGSIATVLTVEGGEAIEGSFSILRMLKKLGISAMTLTWNDDNELASAAMGKKDRGLTQLGVETIEMMNDLNIAVDVSHLSDYGIDDVLKYSTKPIFASHSNCRAIYNSKRSLTDDQIREIAKRGGTVGINFYSKQLNRGFSTSIEHIVKHLLHVVEIGGIDCCAIGSDFDGMKAYPVDLKTSADFPKLAKTLMDNGLTQEETEKIMSGNLSRYIRQFV